MKRLLTIASLAATLLLSNGCTNGGKPEQRLTGGGSSFVSPIMTKWAGLYYKEKSIRIDYTSSGSGNGIQQMIEQKNDFGCTDAPMTDEQLEKAKSAGGAVIHVPLVMGAVVPAYNLKGITEPLRFTGPVLADIFLGKIKRWDDARLKELNPGVTLPGQEIAVVHRSDGSGTTYIWVDYLSKVSPEWKEKVGVGTDVKWSVGVGEQKNDGVAGQISRTPGAIGYIELGFALNKRDILYGSVQNREGEHILASLKSVTTAAEGALTDVPADLRYSLTNAPGKGAYPICGTTWAVLYTAQPADKVEVLTDFLRWVEHGGQQYTEELQYAPLPAGLVQRAEEKLSQVHAKK